MSTRAVIDSFYSYFSQGDLVSVVSLQSEDVIWEFVGPPTIPYFDTYKGHVGVRSFFDRLFAHEEVLRFEPQEFIIEGDKGVVFGSETAISRSSGRQFDSRWVQKFTVKSGKIVHWIEFIDTDAVCSAYR